MRTSLCVLLLCGGLLLGGCASGQQAGSSAASMLAAPASGTAWRVVGGGGSVSAQGSVPPGAPVISVDGSGAIRASLPASAETQQAAPALAPDAFGVIQIRNAR